METNRQTWPHRWPLALALGLICSAGPLAQGTHELAMLIADDTAAGDNFGTSVALDGDTMVVGAPGVLLSGAAYVFVRGGSAWTQQARLIGADVTRGDGFGNAVAISGDTVVVGSFADSDPDDGGSAYVFVRSGTSWAEQAKLTAADGGLYDRFGIDVAIEGDTIVIGAAGYLELRPGAAYVFTRSGSAWVEQAKLTPGDAEEHFGAAVALAGATVVVGTVVADLTPSHDGSAYVFTRNGTSWVEQAKLTAADGGRYDSFGIDVAIEGDTIVVGAAGSSICSRARRTCSRAAVRPGSSRRS